MRRWYSRRTGLLGASGVRIDRESATIAPTPRLRVVARDTVFKATPQLVGSGPATPEDVTRDGRFLGLVTNRNDYELVVVPNWLPELKKRLAGGR